MKHKVNSTFCKAFGEHVRRLREERGFGLREFAMLAEIEHSQLYKIETGQQNPTISTVMTLAEALNVTHIEMFNFQYSVKSKK